MSELYHMTQFLGFDPLLFLGITNEKQGKE